MRRLLVASVCTVALSGAGAGVASAVQPAPSPSESKAVVCDKARTTMAGGMKSFTETMDRAGAAATSGDLARADSTVRQSGLGLVELGRKLRKHGETAQSADLRKALDNVAKELEKLGAGLTGLGSLQNFDTKRLEVFSNRVAEVCQR